MTDEHKNNNINSNNNKSSNNSHPNNENNNERIVAEAASKLPLQNGLNGNQFHLPPPPPDSSNSALRPPTSSPSSPSASTSATASALVTTNGFLPHASTTPTTKANKSSSPRSNLSASTSSSSAMAASAAMVAATTAAAASTPAVPKPVDVIGGVLDYSSLSQAHPGAAKTGKNSNSTGFDMSRHPMSTPTSAANSNYGGRLQFFKNGKFILELARSKDSDRGGWVSVPRKAFRPPSAATSATVTPTSAVTTTYPKNENSTSLSFSDDNSSIQSSPWQRDQPWKQSRPRRGISKELSLYYHRPRQSVLSKRGLQLAARKRRRPHEPICSEEEKKTLFEFIKMEENGDETLKPEMPETPAQEEKDVKAETITAAVLTASVAEDSADDEIKTDKPEPLKDGVKIEEDSQTEFKNSAPSQTTEAIDTTCIAAEKMNTSEDEEALLVVTSDEAADAAVPASKSESTLTSSAPPVNGNASELNGDANSKARTTDIRLKKRKPRAKLSNIIQKLIDGVPARLEQLSKTSAVMASLATASERSAGGAVSSLSHSLTHKVSPPSSAAAASRLVEYHHQHVSPRKRILREFEKVSLEDNGCVNNGSGSSASGSSGGVSGGAGGKRSRAKGCTPSTKSATINLAPPQVKTPSTSIPNAASAAQQQQPTRLNSSYSIHSLLGGSSTSGSTKGSTNDHPAAIISNVHHLHHNPHSVYGTNSASYPRALLGSPKSPDVGAGSNGSGGGGKSPSHVGTKKRSPPYTATGSPLPLDYAHSHSFYAPYAASGTGASPRPSTSGSATVSSHIPHGVPSSNSRELSPARSSTASPATTPRTVPKKTASIRREFASPTASNSCPSPSDRCASPPDRRHMHLQRSSPAAGSPLHYYMYPPPPQVNGSGSTAGTSSPNQTVSATTSTSAAVAAATAAAAAAYIPSVVSPSLYHPYISTLAAMRHNPLWLHHYQTGAGASLLVPPPPPPPHSHQTTGQVAATRLSPSSPYHAFYNGAVAAAAAAAATAFGQPSPSPHTHPHLAHSTALAHMATPKLTDSSTDQMSAATSHRTTSTSPASSSASASSTVASGASTSSAMFHNSNLRNEPSSDLPLNLSKH